MRRTGSKAASVIKEELILKEGEADTGQVEVLMKIWRKELCWNINELSQ